MARLSDGSGSFVELRPLGYVLPAEKLWPGADSFDCNWLHAQLSVLYRGAYWTKHGAAVAVFELQDLAAWLLHLADGGAPPQAEHWQDVEQGITIEAGESAGALEIRLWFNHGFAHPTRNGYVAGNPDEIVDLRPSLAELRRFAAELTDELLAFPLREAPPSE